ncbi:unnamed protein product [Caenorhabditis bovis]|uniref:DUF19 domain-containing protein n=1 Tax=Caenorhabditis bovis TaxID=2654633 RepID=A0A8S1E8J0_9PELO|nr:unnamed protein product [Caenorhabditis bovis]
MLIPVILLVAQIGAQMIPGSNSYISSTDNLDPLVPNRCVNRNLLYSCYVSYLQKYGYSPDGGYLPSFMVLSEQMRSMNLQNICRDFDDLTNCLGTSIDECVNFNTFVIFTNRIRPEMEATLYLENHAFFEFACGKGKQLFFENLDCLQRSFAVVPLSNRMLQCGQGKINYNDASACPQTIETVSCVRRQLFDACGESAGVAACGAASNMERRLQFLNAACLTELDMRCSSFSKLVYVPFLLLIVFYFFSYQ